jgi:hypothetical protein
MRKITRKIAQAFIDRRPLKIDNSETDGMHLYLFGNLIAFNRGECIIMSLAGYPTPTTRERLNGVVQLMDGGRPFFQWHGKQYFDDHYIDDTCTVIWNWRTKTKTFYPQPIEDVLATLR